MTSKQNYCARRQPHARENYMHEKEINKEEERERWKSRKQPTLNCASWFVGLCVSVCECSNSRRFVLHINFYDINHLHFMCLLVAANTPSARSIHTGVKLKSHPSETQQSEDYYMSVCVIHIHALRFVLQNIALCVLCVAP